MSIASLAEMFSTQWDEDHWFPFIEDENCNITGYGHRDLAAFATEVNHYDAVTSGEVVEVDEQWDESYISWHWVRIADDQESFAVVNKDTPGAVPVTALWGHR